MKDILTRLAVFVMVSLATVSGYSQSSRSHVAGNFMLQLDGDGAAGVIAPIDNKGNATIDNVKPGNHTVALLVPAVQKIREAAARAKASNTPPPSIDIESWSWGVSNPKATITGNTTVSNPSWTSMKPTKASLINIVQRKGEEYYKIELENILVSSYQSSSGGSSSDKPQESLSLNFTKIEFKYDLKENKK